MKIQWLDKNWLELVPQSVDDLYYLSRIIEPGDLIRAITLRKIKHSRSLRPTDPAIVKIPITLEVKSTHLDPLASKLRVLGIIRECPSKYSILGLYHTIEIASGKKISIYKERWLKLHLDMLDKALKPRTTMLIVLVDQEEFEIYQIRDEQYQLVTRGYLGSYRQPTGAGEAIYSRSLTDAAKTIIEKARSLSPDYIIVAGPGFFKETMLDKIREQAPALSNKLIAVKASSTGVPGLMECLRSSSLQKVLKDLTITEDNRIIENILERLAKNPNMVAYGLESVEQAVYYGAAELVVLSPSLMASHRDAIERLLEMCEKTGCKYRIIHSDSPSREMLENLGGIMAVLRFRIS